MINIDLQMICTQIKEGVRFLAQMMRAMIAPPMCAACKQFISGETIFCKRCFESINPIVSSTLKITDTYEIKVFAISDYKDPIRTVVLAKSNSNQLASRQLGQLMWHMTDLKNSNFDFLIPIPLHWTRYAQRGYNQAEEIAQVLSTCSGKPIAHPLKRIKRTRFQSMLAFDKRQENLQEAFRQTIPGDTKYQGKVLVLVDDVMTSGATLKEAVRHLRKLKPASIIAVVACRVV